MATCRCSAVEYTKLVRLLIEEAKGYALGDDDEVDVRYTFPFDACILLLGSRR